MPVTQLSQYSAWMSLEVSDTNGYASDSWRNPRDSCDLHSTIACLDSLNTITSANGTMHPLGVQQILLIIFKRQLNIVILRFSTYSKAASLYSWEDNPNKLAK